MLETLTALALAFTPVGIVLAGVWFLWVLLKTRKGQK
jgi:hypothetical protein